MKGIGLIGLGYWGKNILRNIVHSRLWNQIVIFDIDQSRIESFLQLYTNVQAASSVEDLLKNYSIDSVAIITPPSTHFELGQKAILEGKHVLFEKPFTTSTLEARKLQTLAEQLNVKLMVDYTFLFTGAVGKIRELTNSRDLGELLYLDSSRINLGIYRSDINVVFDLACHDISIFQFVLSMCPLSVQATAASHFDNEIENIAYITLTYPNNIIAHINCSWMSPLKIRQMLIGGTNKMIVYDDIQPTDKIKIYEKSVKEVISDNVIDSTLVDYRLGDTHSLKLDNSEALKKVINEFHDLIYLNKTTRCSDSFGIDVLSTLEAIQESINNEGIKVSF